eukprot:m.124224 g.124224  ORF g.124224 m.124224 type:complete len:220 (+) comp13772_c0_seq2:88-747(+)
MELNSPPSERYEATHLLPPPTSATSTATGGISVPMALPVSELDPSMVASITSYRQRKSLWYTTSNMKERRARCEKLQFGRAQRVHPGPGVERSALCKQDPTADSPPCGRLGCGHCSRLNQRKVCTHCNHWEKMAKKVCRCGAAFTPETGGETNPPVALKDKGVTLCMQHVGRSVSTDLKRSQCLSEYCLTRTPSSDQAFAECWSCLVVCVCVLCVFPLA